MRVSSLDRTTAVASKVGDSVGIVLTSPGLVGGRVSTPLYGREWWECLVLRRPPPEVSGIYLQDRNDLRTCSHELTYECVGSIV